jgi:AcrR family transcriptional regulator
MPKRSRPTDGHGDAIVDATLGLAAEIGWHAVSLAGIAERAGVTLSEVYERFHGKLPILRDYYDSLDQALMKGDLPAAGDSPRDRLFDVMMRRFDAMQHHKQGIRSIANDCRTDPWVWVCVAPRMFKTAALTLEAAGISAWGPIGRMKAKAVLAIYALTFRSWLNDDTDDMAKTMASLDRSLRRAEEVAMLCCRVRRRLPLARDEAQPQNA